jgi:hypothetical protein
MDGRAAAAFPRQDITYRQLQQKLRKCTDPSQTSKAACYNTETFAVDKIRIIVSQTKRGTATV